MSNYWFRRAAQALPNPGTEGPWSLRFAQGLANLGSFGDSSVAALDGVGHPMAQLWRALSPKPSFGGSTWSQRLAGGGGKALYDAAVAAAAAAEEEEPAGDFIRNAVNTTVTYQAETDDYKIEKTGGADNAYNASAVSDTPLTGDFILRFTLNETAMQCHLGVTTDPLASNAQTTIDFALNFDGANSISLRENGVSTYLFPGITYSGGEHWFIKRSGSTLSFGKGGDDGVTGYTEHVTRNSADTLYFDSGFSNNEAGRFATVKRIA